MVDCPIEWIADIDWSKKPQEPQEPSFTKCKMNIFQRMIFRGGIYKYIPATGVSTVNVISWLAENMPNVHIVVDDALSIKFNDESEVMAFKLVWVY
jgi:hypothetical protein